MRERATAIERRYGLAHGPCEGYGLLDTGGGRWGRCECRGEPVTGTAVQVVERERLLDGQRSHRATPLRYVDVWAGLELGAEAGGYGDEGEQLEGAEGDEPP